MQIWQKAIIYCNDSVYRTGTAGDFIVEITGNSDNNIEVRLSVWHSDADRTLI